MLLACSCLADAARQLVAPSVQRLVSFFCLSLSVCIQVLAVCLTWKPVH
ncbi:hypothetical protein D918_05527 [Trichuris suis]|nr:hypothetical protein D918_05527 [Trichuris suis]